MREKKIFCIYGCFGVTRYIKGRRKSHFQAQLNFQIHIRMHKQPTLTKQWNYIMFVQYYLVISEAMVASSLDVLFLYSLQYYQCFMRNQEGLMIELQKSYIHFFDCTPSFLYLFLLLSLSTLFPFSSDILAEMPFLQIHC